MTSKHIDPSCVKTPQSASLLGFNVSVYRNGFYVKHAKGKLIIDPEKSALSVGIFRTL